MSDRSQLAMTTVVQASANEVSTLVDDEAVILDLDTSVYFSLDAVGARVFALLAQPTRLQDVLAKVVAEFDVDESTARTDLLALVGDLLENRLVVVTSPDAP